MTSPNSKALASSSINPHVSCRNPLPRPRANEPPPFVNVGDARIRIEQRDTHVTVRKPSASYAEHYERFCLVSRIYGKRLDAEVVIEKANLLWNDVQGTLKINKLANNWFRLEFSLEQDLLYVLDERP